MAESVEVATDDPVIVEECTDEQNRTEAMSGGLTITGEAAQSSAVKETAKSSPVEETAQSSAVEETAKSSPVEETAKSSPLEETAKSSPVEETAQSSAVEETAKSSPVEETAKSSPVEETAQSSVVEETAKSSAVEETAQSSAGQETAQGGAGPDTTQSGAGPDTAESSAGSDTAQSGAGPDTAQSGAGPDTAQSGAGHDIAQGGEGQEAVQELEQDQKPDPEVASEKADEVPDATTNKIDDKGAGQSKVQTLPDQTERGGESSAKPEMFSESDTLPEESSKDALESTRHAVQSLPPYVTEGGDERTPRRGSEARQKERDGEDGRESADMDDAALPSASQIAALQALLAVFDAKGVQALVDKGLDVSMAVVDPQKVRTALHELVLDYVTSSSQEKASNFHPRFLEVLDVLLQNGVEVNDVDIARNSALHFACHYPGFPQIIRVLLAKGAHANMPNQSNRTPLHLAAKVGNCKAVELLLDGGADPELTDCMAMSPLHLAAKVRENSDVIKYLVGCGSSVNHCHVQHGMRGSTPLHVAVHACRFENVKSLLDLGACADIEDASGQTALHLAAVHDISGRILQLLLDSGASINHRDSVYGETPLHKAVKRARSTNIYILCQHGADANVPDRQGDSALHKAAEFCRDHSVWMKLLNSGADANLRNRKDITPLERALKASNKVAATAVRQLHHW